jgi:hypothetical protein
MLWRYTNHINRRYYLLLSFGSFPSTLSSQGTKIDANVILLDSITNVIILDSITNVILLDSITNVILLDSITNVILLDSITIDKTITKQL